MGTERAKKPTHKYNIVLDLPVSDQQLLNWESLWWSMGRAPRREAVRILCAEVRRLRRKLLKHGGHTAECGQTTSPHTHRGRKCDEHHGCDCGWDRLVKDLRVR